MRGIATRLATWMAAWATTLCLAAAAAGGEVQVALERFGAARAYRPGDVAGIRLRLTSSRDAPVECVVQWEMENADGDLTAHARSVTLAPNQPVQRWLYARLPASNDPTLAGQVFTVRVFEAREGARLREIGSLNFAAADAEQASVPVGMQEGVIALLARGRVGLGAMQAVVDGSEVPSMNEVTRLASSVQASDLPDRWEGLMPVSTLVWASEGPQALSPERATALLQWIERGGHLVIVLPESGDPWQLRGGSHGLSALLPRSGSLRVDGLAIEPLLPVLTKARSMRRGGARMAATLFDAKTLDPAWRALVSIPPRARPNGVEASALVVQRPWGHGRVTLVGLDLDALQSGASVAGDAPQADVFWNPVLGHRADAPLETDYATWQQAQPRGKLVPTDRVPIVDVSPEALVTRRIGQVGRASVGVLAVLGFFLCYWIVAVPGVWLLLRRRKLERWSWPAFALVALAATPAAWALGIAFGGSPVEVRHLTVADFVLAPGDDGSRASAVRANAWMSASLGGFGSSEIAIDDAPGSASLLLDWGGTRSRDQRFPDTARSDREIDRPWTLRMPARATTTDLQAWWTGAPASWGKVAWQEPGRPVTTECSRDGTERIRLRGAIRHGLPAALRRVRIFHVMPFHYETRRWRDGPASEIEPSGLPPCPARVVDLVEPWDGSPLDLGAALYPEGPQVVASIDDRSLVKSVLDQYWTPLARRDLTTATGLALGNDALGEFDWKERFAMLSLFQMLRPPLYLRAADSARMPENVRVHRSLGREMDLSPWFVRPCVIVTGWLDEAPCPVPLRIDGSTPSSEGSTLVRLVLPLEEPDRGFVTPLSGIPVR